MTGATVCTDHDALKSMMPEVDATRSLVFWHLRLLALSFNVAHQLCTTNRPADALSRLQSTGVDKAPVDEEVSVQTIGTVETTNVEGGQFDSAKTTTIANKKRNIMDWRGVCGIFEKQNSVNASSNKPCSSSSQF